MIVLVQHPYEAAREAFAEQVRDADPDAVVPACPEWTVRELLAHQVHQLQGALDRSFPVRAALNRLAPGSEAERRDAERQQEAWISRGVAEWSKRTIDGLLETWSVLARDAPIEVLDALVPDVVVHLFDLLGVTGVRGYRDHAIVERALSFWAGAAGVEMPDTVEGRFELLRIVTGRRSRAQAPDVDVRAALYGWRSDDLVE